MDIWDFSALFESWSGKPPTQPRPTDNYAEVTERMQQEMDEISSQIALLDSGDPTALSNLHLLTIPPSTSTHSEPDESPSLAANQRLGIPVVKLPPLSPVSKPAPKAKESMQMRSKRVVATPIKEPPNRPVFRATPSELKVVNFELSREYYLKFTLQNCSSHTCGFHLRSPADPAFRIRILDEVKNSEVRPGLHLTFEVVFFPTEPRDYHGSISIIPGPDLAVTTILLRCYRDPPVLHLPGTVDLGATLVYSVKPGEFTIANRGGIAHFELHSPSGHEESETYTDGAFSLVPSQFELNRGQSITINVQFKPVTTGEHSASFEIRPRHFPGTFSFIAKGDAAVPSLKFAICDDDRLLLPFLPADANTTRALEIRNDADVSYPFSIQVFRAWDDTRSDLARLYPDTDTTTVQGQSSPFTISPMLGLIGARESVTLNVGFAPTVFAFYRINIILSANRIPDETGTLGSRKMLTIAAEATTGPPSVAIQPPLVLFSDVVPRRPTVQSIDVVNDSSLGVKLQWRKSDVITPSPVVFDVNSHKRSPVELSCCLTQAVRGVEPSTSAIFKHFWKDRVSVSDRVGGPPPSQHYAIAFLPLSRNVARESPAPVQAVEQEDEMPNLFSVRHSVSFWNNPARDDVKLSASVHPRDDVTLRTATSTEMTFVYSAKVLDPSLLIDPPVVDFGCVLSGKMAHQVLTFRNSSGCPIGYSIEYDQMQIDQPTGIVGDSPVAVGIDLQCFVPTPVSLIITIRSWWVDTSNAEIPSLPRWVCDVPIYAVFDYPIIEIP
jgi:hypothetical protein